MEKKRRIREKRRPFGKTNGLIFNNNKRPFSLNNNIIRIGIVWLGGRCSLLYCARRYNNNNNNNKIVNSTREMTAHTRSNKLGDTDL